MRINPAGATAVVFLCAAISGPARADPPGTFHAYGVGGQSCGVWLDDRRKGAAGEDDLGWLLGWVSAAGAYNVRGDLRHVDARGQAAWVDKYCREHPLDKIFDAAMKLVETLARPE